MSPFLFKRLSDESLGSRLASGEAAAFDELYRRYVHRLAAYGSHLLGDPVAGDDVAQATLLKAYGALRDGRVPEKVRPWLFRIAHNTAIDLVVRRRELLFDEVPEGPTRDPEPLAGALVTALAGLPDRQRRVYVLRELHGMRIAETATELGLTTTQVEQALFAARNRLAELLVFGEKLDCVSVRRLAAGPLDANERRALKTHLRSCPQCRKAVPLRSRAPVALAGPSLEWLRGLLVGGAAPAAAKVGAVVATMTIAGSVPMVARVKPEPVPHMRPVPVVHVRAASSPVRATVAKATPVVLRAPTSVRPVTVAPAPQSVRRHEVEPEHRASRARGSATHDRRGGGGEPSVAVTPPPITTTSGEHGTDGHSGPAAETPTTTITAPDSALEGGGSGESSDSGHDGGSDGGGGGTDGGGGGSGSDGGGTSGSD